jgi:vitamin B12 transporter
VVITASRTLETIREVTSNITVLDQEFVSNSSAQTVAQLLSQAGFQVIGYNAGGLAITIRGMSQSTITSGGEGASRVLVLFNGRRINVTSSDFTGIANIEKVEIIRGPTALQYGPSAVGCIL